MACVEFAIPVFRVGDRVRLKFDGSRATIGEIRTGGRIVVKCDDGAHGTVTRYGLERSS